jgi:hypothetical protein
MRLGIRISEVNIFFPVILLFFPDTSNPFPVIFLRDFDEKPAWMLGFETIVAPIYLKMRVFPVFFPVIGDFAFGNWFVSDCAHHHPVSANRTLPVRRQIGRFCGDFRPLNSRIFVSAGVHAFWRRFLRPVSASKNSVPGGRDRARGWTALHTEFRL